VEGGGTKIFQKGGGGHIKRNLGIQFSHVEEEGWSKVQNERITEEHASGDARLGTRSKGSRNTVPRIPGRCHNPGRTPGKEKVENSQRSGIPPKMKVQTGTMDEDKPTIKKGSKKKGEKDERGKRVKRRSQKNRN